MFVFGLAPPPHDSLRRPAGHSCGFWCLHVCGTYALVDDTRAISHQAGYSVQRAISAMFLVEKSAHVAMRSADTLGELLHLFGKPAT